MKKSFFKGFAAAAAAAMAMTMLGACGAKGENSAAEESEAKASVSGLGQSTGFRDLKWGMTLDEVKAAEKAPVNTLYEDSSDDELHYLVPKNELGVISADVFAGTKALLDTIGTDEDLWVTYYFGFDLEGVGKDEHTNGLYHIGFSGEDLDYGDNDVDLIYDKLIADLNSRYGESTSEANTLGLALFSEEKTWRINENSFLVLNAYATNKYQMTIDIYVNDYGVTPEEMSAAFTD